MILTKTRLKAVLELMEGTEPEGFAERAMAEFGPGSTWAKGNKAKCPPDTWCDYCEVEYCNAGAPTLFEFLSAMYVEMRNEAWRPIDEESDIPF